MLTIDSKLFAELRDNNQLGFIIAGDGRVAIGTWEVNITRGIKEVTKPGAEWEEYEDISIDDPFMDAHKYRVSAVIPGKKRLIPGRRYTMLFYLRETESNDEGAYLMENITFTDKTAFKKNKDGVDEEYKIFEGSNRTKTKLTYHAGK